MLPVLPADGFHQGALHDGLLLGVLLQQELHQYPGLPGHWIFVSVLSGRGFLGGTCTLHLGALGTFIRFCT